MDEDVNDQFAIVASVANGASAILQAMVAVRSSLTWIKNADAFVTFQVANVTHASLIYEPLGNPDPGGDSDGTQITVFKP